MKDLLLEKRAQSVIQEIFMFLKFRNTILLRGV
jgi:hypothetical protein